jgi:hypothetical protein
MYFAAIKKQSATRREDIRDGKVSNLIKRALSRFTYSLSC